MTAAEIIPEGPFLSVLRADDDRYRVEQAERLASQDLLVKCAEQSVRAVHTAIASTLGRPGGMQRQRTRVASTLLLRAADDLDAFVMLALSGYPLQAATIGASLWEKVQCINLVVTSDDDATKWLAGAIDLSADHPFWRTKTYRRGFDALAKTINAPVTYEDALLHYESLCRAKHAHPWIMEHYAIRRTDNEGTEFVYGPTGSSGWRLAVGEFAPIVLATLLWGVVGYANANEDLLDERDRSLAEALAASFELRVSLSAEISREFRTTVK
ncbi:MAG: hypothetical protein IT353_18925 [Gemmatimonadaceae bacterium]|nr:hypothetical protein [Gemmatimonadaceae bacterium]